MKVCVGGGTVTLFTLPLVFVPLYLFFEGETGISTVNKTSVKSVHRYEMSKK